MKTVVSALKEIALTYNLTSISVTPEQAFLMITVAFLKKAKLGDFKTYTQLERT